MMRNILNVHVYGRVNVIAVFGLYLIIIGDGLPLPFTDFLFHAMPIRTSQIHFAKRAVNTCPYIMAIFIFPLVTNRSLRNASHWVLTFCGLLHNQATSKRPQA